MSREAESSKKRILVADDEPSVLYSVERILGNEYAVLKASNGEEAVTLARSEKPDIILMDTMMPKKDGLTACYEIKADEATKAIPVIMLTGVGHDLNKSIAQSAYGASEYITKPYKPQELLDTIARFLKNSD